MYDLLVPELGMVIDVDGDYWHRSPAVKERDKRKDARARRCGVTVVRIAESGLKGDVTKAVRDAMAGR